MFVKIDIVQIDNDYEYTLSYGPNFVMSPTFTLYKEQADEYTYPIDGWYWVTELEQFFNLPEFIWLKNNMLSSEEEFLANPNNTYFLSLFEN